MIHSITFPKLQILQIANREFGRVDMHPVKPQFRTIKQNYQLKADFEYLAENNYTVLKQIGRGSYGVVYKAEDKNLGGYCAIKINFNIILRQQLYVQMALLNLMRNKRRLPFLHRVIQKKGTYSIVMDYHKSKSFITFFSNFPWIEIKHYLFELLLGLKQLKQLGIYHRDIKPSNFLYDQVTKKGVIVDYGLGEVDPQFVKNLQQKLQNQEDELELEEYEELKERLDIYKNIENCLSVVGRNKIGTQIFMPPQSVLRTDNQTYSSDIWPVGIIFLQFCAQRFNIFYHMTQLQNYFNLPKGGFYVGYLLQLGALFGKQKVCEVCRECFDYQLSLPGVLREYCFESLIRRHQYDENARDLLLKLLALNPKDRITPQEALNHKFFDEIRQDHLTVPSQEEA